MKKTATPTAKARAARDPHWLTLRLVMRQVDSYAIKSTTAALMHNDEKLDIARQARSDVEKMLRKIFAELASSRAETQRNVRDERLASKLNKR